MSDIQYDRQGRIKYNPDFHPNHGKQFTDEEKAYMCRWHEIDGRRSISYALGRTEGTIASMITTLKNKGKYDYYKRKWDEYAESS